MSLSYTRETRDMLCPTLSGSWPAAPDHLCHVCGPESPSFVNFLQKENISIFILDLLISKCQAKENTSVADFKQPLI